MTQLAAERNLPREVVLRALESALLSAYRKDNPQAPSNLEVRIHPETGEIVVYYLKTAVEAVATPQEEIELGEARRYRPEATLGDIIAVPSHSIPAGRIGAQVAKQVILQKLREAERGVVYDEYSAKEGEVVSGVIQRLEPNRSAIVDLGRMGHPVEAVLPTVEQIPGEPYRPGTRFKFYLLEVQRSARGPQIVLSRTHRNLVKRLLEMEVPEIFQGVVEVKAIAREPGQRTKVAVAARQEGVDPVGCCVGLRGLRIQNIVNELRGEKIDVVLWHQSMGSFIGHALSPAQVTRVEVDEAQRVATVVVPDRQLSLAIGKEGQNARLAAKLTGWRIDIKSVTDAEKDRAAARVAAPPTPVAAKVAPEPVAAAPAAPPEAVGAAPPTPVQQREKAPVAPVPVAAVPAAAVPVAPVPTPREAPPAKAPVLVGAENEGEGFTSLEEALAPLASLSSVSSSGKPQIRFAEEIMAGRSTGGGPERKKRRKSGRSRARPGHPGGGEEEP